MDEISTKAPKYSLQKKNQIFRTIQQYVNENKFSKRDMIDLHIILTQENPTYSQNKNGTLYTSKKYTDSTFTEIECFLTRVKIRLDVESKKIYKQELLIENIGTKMDIVDSEDRDFGFGEHKLYNYKAPHVSRGSHVRVRVNKINDIFKKNDAFKHLIKKSKKTSCIPIHYEEKQLSSFSPMFYATIKHRMYQVEAFDNEDDHEDIISDDEDKNSSCAEEETHMSDESFYNEDDDDEGEFEDDDDEDDDGEEEFDE